MDSTGINKEKREKEKEKKEKEITSGIISSSVTLPRGGNISKINSTFKSK